MGRNIKIGVLIAVFLTCFLINDTKFAVADVTDIEYDSPSFVKTDPIELEQNDSSDTGDSRNWFEKLLDDIKDKIYDLGEYIQDEIEKFKEWAPGALDELKDRFFEGLDAIGDFFVSVWENEWVQVVVGAVVATGAIIGVLFLVGTPIGWGVLAVVGGGALLGGGIYKLIAGDNFTFWGSLLSSVGGGLAGYGIYAGLASGLFTVTNFVKARLWGSMAVALIRQNLVNSWATLMLYTKVGLRMYGASIASGATYLGTQIARFGSFLASKIAPQGWKIFARNAGLAGTMGAFFNGYLYFATTAPGDRAWKDFLIETAIGGASGILLSPFLLVKTLKTGGKLFLAGYAGLENFLIEGLKSGEWTWQSAAIGVAAGLFVGYVVSPMLTNGTKLLKGLLNGGKTDLNTVDDILVDNATKKFGADMRTDINDIFDNYDINSGNGGKDVSDHKLRPDPQIEPKQTPDMDPKPEPQPDAKPESQLDPRPEPQPDPKPEPQPDAKPESQLDPRPEPQPDPRPEPQPDPKPEPQPDAKPEPQPDAKPEPQPDAKPEPQPDAKPEPQPDVKPDSQPDLKPDPQPEADPDQTSDEPVEDPNGGQELDVGEDKADNLDEVENGGHSSKDVNDREPESSVSENQSSMDSNRFDKPQPSFAK